MRATCTLTRPAPHPPAPLCQLNGHPVTATIIITTHLLRTEGIASLLLTAASPRRPPVHRVCLVFEPACLHISCATPIVGFTPLLPKSAQLFPSLALNFDFKHNKGCIPTDSTVGSLGIVGQQTATLFGRRTGTPNAGQHHRHRGTTASKSTGHKGSS